jgi:GTP-binding protein
MHRLKFTHCVFLASAYEVDQIPAPHMAEVAIVGRSNVGKSSLINALFNGKKLAKVSSTPGKTASINFFSVDDQFCLVDLPGYGYAKVSRPIQEKWTTLIETYLNQKRVHLILLLLDCRHPPTNKDLAFAEWAKHHQIPVLFIFTKADKLNEAERKRSIERNLEVLKPFFPEPDYLAYSIKEPRARSLLVNLCEQLIFSRSSMSFSSSMCGHMPTQGGRKDREKQPCKFHK